MGKVERSQGCAVFENGRFKINNDETIGDLGAHTCKKKSCKQSRLSRLFSFIKNKITHGNKNIERNVKNFGFEITSDHTNSTNPASQGVKADKVDQVRQSSMVFERRDEGIVENEISDWDLIKSSYTNFHWAAELICETINADQEEKISLNQILDEFEQGNLDLTFLLDQNAIISDEKKTKVNILIKLAERAYQGILYPKNRINDEQSVAGYIKELRKGY